MPGDKKPAVIETLNDVPENLRKRVQDIIQRRIDERMNMELDILRHEYKIEIENQKMQQRMIANHLAAQ